MSFDLTEWTEYMQMDDNLDQTTRMLLYQYSRLFDSQGRATTKAKVLSKVTGVPERAVRKHLIRAKNAEWLEQVSIDGKKGYRATLPSELM